MKCQHGNKTEQFLLISSASTKVLIKQMISRLDINYLPLPLSCACSFILSPANSLDMGCKSGMKRQIFNTWVGALGASRSVKARTWKREDMRLRELHR